MPLEKKIVVNADDFGFSNSVNRAIIQAHRSGILTSASLMVTGVAFEQAVEMARANPRLGVGLHLVIGKGKAALPYTVIQHLVNKHGDFPDDPLTVGLRYQFNPSARKELLLEIRAQLQLFKETGLVMTHVDGHLHNHVHPYVLQCLVSLSEEFGIRYIRLPKEELSIHRNIGSHFGASQMIMWMIFSLLRAYGEKVLARYGIGYCDRVYGLLQTGNINERYLCKLFPRVNAKRVEIYCHPDQFSNEITVRHSNRGAYELLALTSQTVSKAIIDNGFKLVTFRDL